MSKKTLTHALLCLLFVSVIEVGYTGGVNANPYHPGYRFIDTPSILLTNPSDWAMNQNVTIAFTISIPISWNGSVCGTVTSIQCFLDNNQIVEDDTTRRYSNNGGQRCLNYAKKVGPLTFGEHTITIKVLAYSIYKGEDTKNSASSTKNNKFTVSLDPKPAPTISARLTASSTIYFDDNYYLQVYVYGPQELYNYNWYIDNQKVQTTNYSHYPKYTESIEVGEHQAYVEVSDSENVTGKTSTVTFTVLPSLPFIRINAPTNRTVYNTSELVIDTETLAKRVIFNGSNQFETLQWINCRIDGTVYPFTNITFVPNKYPYTTLASTDPFSLPDGLHQVTVYGETTFGAKVNSNATFWVYEGEAVPSPLPTITPSPSPSPSYIPSPTEQPTPEQTPTATANFSSEWILYPVIALAVMIGAGTVFYFKKRKIHQITSAANS